MAALPDSVREALEDTNFWHIATINPDGSPQSTPVWVKLRDGRIVVNTALGRKKPRNIDNDPRVALSWHGTDADGGYRNIAIQGRVVETITGDQAEQDIDDLALKYIGQERYPWRKDGEQRVTYLIEPLRILGG
jgi:PPOX class probable F420-dependent enzyme